MFLTQSLGKSFMNGQYKEHRETVLFEREMGMLQATQQYAEQKLELERMKRELCDLHQQHEDNRDVLAKRIAESHPKFGLDCPTGKCKGLKHMSDLSFLDHVSGQRYFECRTQICTKCLGRKQQNHTCDPKAVGLIKSFRTEIRGEKKAYLANVKMLREEIKELEGTVGRARREFVRKCPNNGCHGFLSTALKCKLCECWACKHCREMCGFTVEERDAHECNPEIVESVKLLEQDSKPCPKCSALIFKIDGCDQMYCVECHTPFSWNTLRIEHGTIHNPHYFEFQRRMNGGVMPRNPMDIQCGREIDFQFLETLGERYKDIEPMHIDSGFNLGQQLIHMREVELPRFITPNRLGNNLTLRIDFMLKRVTEKQMKCLIFKREKENEKCSEIANVMAMYMTCMTDLFYVLYEKETHDDNAWIDTFREMNVLREYVNTCFTDVSKTYNCKEYSVNQLFQFS
jgi:hypothetical protein